MTTTVRGFKLNNCKKCGKPATVKAAFFANAVVGSNWVLVRCLDATCDSGGEIKSTLALAGRAWNRVN